MKGKDAKQSKTHLYCVGFVPGIHQVCSPLILPADEVMERNPSVPVKVKARKWNEPEMMENYANKGVLPWFSSSLQTSHVDFLYVFIDGKAIWLIVLILPVPCCEGTSLSGDAKGLHLVHLNSCIYIMSTATRTQKSVRIFGEKIWNWDSHTGIILYKEKWPI